MKLIIIWLISVMSVVSLNACGMQGDLYLPEDSADTQTENTQSK